MNRDRYYNLMQRIAAGECILIDGATGTEVERRGVVKNKKIWNGAGALSDPDVVRQIHEDYLRHGAEIVISNTFGNSRRALENAGLGQQFEFLNRRGVELATEARDNVGTPDALVAGGITHWVWTGVPPTPDELYSGVAEQAAIMKQAGADLLMLEMMVDIPRMLVVLEAAQSSGLPVWAGLSCEPKADGAMHLLEGEPLAEALSELQDKQVPLISVMHTEVAYIDACLDIIQENWSGRIGVYAHTGCTVDSDWVFDGAISPEDYATACKRWLDRGAQVIGGCCGIRVEHIQAIREIIR